MNAPAKNTAIATAQPVKSVTMALAERYGMNHEAFEKTLRATVFPKDGSREQLAAFLLVAKEYDLNPMTKEIFAFPAKGGGIVPIVSIDGWCNLVNSHPKMDGMEFDETHDEKNKLISTTCRIYRKDRAKPTVVTEYLSECRRNTDAWKMEHRMLRHKSMIQCARYAFGFAGIYDEDEGEKIAQAPVTLEPPAPPPPPPEPVTHDDDGVIDATYTEHAPPAPPAEAAHQAGGDVPSDSPPADPNPASFDFEKIVADFEAAVIGADEPLLDELREDVFAKIDGADMPRAFMNRIQNAYEGALQKLHPPEPTENEQPEPPAPAPEPARQEVGDDGFPDTTPQESEDVQLAAVQKDHAAMVRQLARQKARKGISFWKRWKGGLKPDELEIVEAMVEYSDGTLQAWAKRADAARPKDDF